MGQNRYCGQAARIHPDTYSVGSWWIFCEFRAQDRAARQKTVEIAITVLQSKDPGIPELRAWARGVFNETLAAANASLPPAAQKELDKVPLPSTVDAAGVDFVARFEGVHLKAYLDTDGTWTIGYGHTGPDVFAGEEITLDMAKQLLAADLKAANDAVDSAITVPISQNQRDALLSFIRNVGAGIFKKSSIPTLINSGQFDKVPEQLRKWVGSPPRLGLQERREREIDLWNQQ